MLEQTIDWERINRIFFPYVHDRVTEARRSVKRFVHYTNAESAISIIKNKEIWMRKSSCMNDFSEVQHGLNCLYNARRNESGKRLQDVFRDELGIDAFEVENAFASWVPHFQCDTYLACFSEHLNEEDDLGRLSMWRAYGDVTGIAIVMNSSSFLDAFSSTKAYVTPVAYLNDQEFQNLFGYILNNVMSEKLFLKTQPINTLKNCLFNVFRLAALGTKHPGFKEEAEWRIIYTPNIDRSESLKKEVQIIKGVPQPIYKVPLVGNAYFPAYGLDIPSVVNRVIIGPSQYPQVIKEAFLDLLGEAGVPDPESRVFTSYIPLRR